MQFRVQITEREEIYKSIGVLHDDKGLQALDGFAQCTVTVEAESEDAALHKALNEYKPQLKHTDKTTASIVK